MPSGPANAAAPSATSLLSGAHTHTPHSLLVSHTASHCYNLPRTLGHGTACIHTRHTHHAPMPRTAQVQTRQVHQLAQRIHQCGCPLCTRRIAWCPHSHPNASTSVTQLHTATDAHAHSDAARHVYTYATHTPRPHATYRASPDVSGAPTCPADPPMLLPPLHPAHCLMPTHPPQPPSTSVTQLHTATTAHAHSGMARHAYTHATHTTPP